MRALCASMMFALAGPMQAQDVATLRGRDAQQLSVEQADASGITGTFAGTRLLVTWDRVRTIEGDTGDRHAAFLDAGELLWRGISRLDRGDPIAAIAALEKSYEVFGAELGATGAVAADAILAAELELANVDSCVVPWLHLLEHDLAQLGPRSVHRAAIDADTALVPELPPIFLPSRAAARHASEIASNDFERWTAGSNRWLAEAYASAFLIAAGERPPPLDGDAPSDAVRLVRAMVEARSEDPGRRLIARKALQEFLGSEPPAWIRSWCHAGIGLSLLLESESQRLAGVGHLLVVPSVYGDAQPYLAGICLARSAEALSDAGRVDAAGRLIDELERRSPRHPALSLPALRGIRVLNRPSPTNGTGP